MAIAPDRRFLAKPLGVGTLLAVAFVLATTMEWGEAEDTASPVNTHAMGAGPMPAAAAPGGTDPFYEQKKAARESELPAQF